MIEGNMKIIIILLTVPLSLISCSTDTRVEALTDASVEATLISAYKINNTAISGRSVSFVVNCVIPDPCWAFVRTEVTTLGKDVFFKVYARSTSSACTEVYYSLDAPASVTLQSSGTYIFHFWQYNDKTLDTTIVVQ
jgi:hypothetical protein